MRILIVKMSSMGDIIHALPVLDFLKQAVPSAEVDWVVEEPFKDVLAGNPLICRLHLVRTKVWRKRPLAAETRREIGELKEKMRELAYDFVFDIQGNLKSGLISRLARGKVTIGLAKPELQESINAMFTDRQIPVRKQDRHVTDKCLRIVSVPFGKDFAGLSLATDIATGEQEDLAAEALVATLPDGYVFLMHCGTTWQTKYWYRDGWIALAKSLLDSYHDSSVLLTWGNESERREAMEIAAVVGVGACLTGSYSLKGLAALLKKVDLVVGGDTGPVHLAAAVGTPTVSLYRSSDGTRSGPRGTCHVLVEAAMDCRRCFRTSCSRDEECRRSIVPEKVFAAVSAILPPSDPGSAHPTKPISSHTRLPIHHVPEEL